MKSVLVRILSMILIFPHTFWGFLKKDAVLILRKKKFLLLSLALPLLIGLLYIGSLTGGDRTVSIAACDYDGTTLTHDVLSGLEGFSVTVGEGDCLIWLKQNIRERNYLFGIVIAEGFTDALSSYQQAPLLVYYDNSDPSIASLASWKLDAALMPFNEQVVLEFGSELKTQSGVAHDKFKLALELSESLRGSIFSGIKKDLQEVDETLKNLRSIDEQFLASPVKTQGKGVYDVPSGISVGIVPLFVVISLFVLLMLASTNLLYDKKSGLFARIRASPASMISYLLAKLVFYFVLLVIQFLFVLVIFYAFGASYTISFGLLIKALIFIGLVNALLGLLIGLVSDSEGVAVLISLAITLPLMFLSGMFYPLELMPKALQFVARILPVQAEMLFLKQALFFGGVVVMKEFWMPIVLFVLALYLLRKQ
ncbi:MAG: ABC transporter permease [Candidatus Woesearchaeota archaeon]|nr:MAG: ABC transporter permease [Candidatus Woesearchaeota archaeon]